MVTRASIGARLRAAREAAALSQQEAADALRTALGRKSFTRANVGYMESGARRVSLDELPAIARVYGTTEAALMSATGAPVRPKRATREAPAAKPSPARRGPPDPCGRGGDLVIAAMGRIRAGDIREETFEDE